MLNFNVFFSRRETLLYLVKISAVGFLVKNSHFPSLFLPDNENQPVKLVIEFLRNDGKEFVFSELQTEMDSVLDKQELSALIVEMMKENTITHFKKQNFSDRHRVEITFKDKLALIDYKKKANALVKNAAFILNKYKVQQTINTTVV